MEPPTAVVLERSPRHCGVVCGGVRISGGVEGVVGRKSVDIVAAAAAVRCCRLLLLVVVIVDHPGNGGSSSNGWGISQVGACCHRHVGRKGRDNLEKNNKIKINDNCKKLIMAVARKFQNICAMCNC